MPELPEVQTVVSDLNEKIIGDTITDFSSAWPKAIKGKTLTVFKKEIVGRKILGVRRLGKNIFVDLSGGKTLYLHLKMTGHLLIKSQIKDEFRPEHSGSNFDSNSNLEFKKLEIDSKFKIKNSKLKSHDYFADQVNQYIRHRFFLRTDTKLRNIDESTNKKSKSVKNFVDSNTFVGSNRYDKVMEFSDMRKFAKIVLGDTQDIANLPEIKSLGIDAMDPRLDFKKFDALLTEKKKMAIGIWLMDQHLLAGIGNIYRSEILFAAGVLPERKNESLTPVERKKIWQAMRSILKKAIRMRGTTDSDYRDTSGAPGGFQNVLQVYGKTGEKCQKCATIVARSKMGQRSVFYCPGCQK